MTDDFKLEELPQTRTKKILEINVVESLIPIEEGLELNEGYTYDVTGSIPQIADGIAKMAIEMNRHEEFGENGGEMFLTFIIQFYEKEKGGN